jgi:hypothetical protein
MPQGRWTGDGARPVGSAKNTLLEEAMNGRRLAAAAAAICLVAASQAALAANVTMVRQKLDVAGAPADVWAKIGGFCAIGTWHPAVGKCEESKDGDVVRRVLTLKDGAVIREKLTGTSETGYTYAIEESPLPVKNYTASFSVMGKPDAEGTTTIIWSSNFEASGKTDAEAKAVIGGVFEAGMANLKDTLAAK